jgi:hypothetical protein
MSDFEEVQKIFNSMDEQDKMFFGHDTVLKNDIDPQYLIYREIVPNVAVCELFFLNRQQITERKYVGISIMVNPTHRNNGIAEKLMLKAMDVVKKNGFSAISVDVYTENIKSQNLLKKLGFERKYSYESMTAYIWVNKDKFKENNNE